MVQPLKFENGYVISSHTLLGMRLLIYVRIKDDPYYVVKGTPARYTPTHKAVATLMKSRKSNPVWSSNQIVLNSI